MLLSSVTALLFTNPGKAVTAMIAGSHASVKLAIELAALYGFWLGFFGIIEKIGLADKLGRLLHPVVNFLFPGLNKKGEKYVTMNMAANLLGLGNASTPMAIKAIKEMDDGSGKVSQNMIMLTVLSSTSLQLLPTTVIGLRATHGSVNPADFLIPATVATIVSTVLGITLVKLIGLMLKKRKSKKEKKKAGAPLPLSAKTL
jgi:spore maturation protein A